MTERFAGREWYYSFKEISSTFDEAKCQVVSNRLLERYSLLTRAWTNELNSEWICRLYMSAKLIMAATLKINSASYSEDHNLRVVIPYLRYYAALSLLRSICYTLPEHEWKGGALIQIPHKSAIDGAIEHIRRFSPDIAKSVEWQIRELKAERELISYRAPSSGDDQVSEKSRFLSLCALLAEIAQFNSELLEVSLHKKTIPESFVFDLSYAEGIAGIEIDGHYFGDTEDAYRLSYLARKQNYPTNIMFLMTEGHVEDFFGAWHVSDGSPDLFNPDEATSIIFDIP